MKQDLHQHLEPGGYYHIYNRGNNNEIIFKEPRNYYHFLSLWIKHIDPVAKTFCYNLLPNHFHFFIKIEKMTNDLQYRNVSQAFSNLFNAYAKAINKAYSRTGSLFQERFKRKEIISDAYFTALIGYILTNAVRHKYCKDISDYPYSSYHSLVSDKPTRLLRDEVIRWFNNRDAFIEYIKSYQQDIIDQKFILENVNDDWVDLTGFKNL